MAGTLYIVPTPIGNLEDMTYRAIACLKEVDLILAEDTRTSGKLLKHFEINTPMRANHMHNEHRQSTQYVSLLQSGQNIALISDAGTPAISDPGYLMVREAIKEGIPVICLPGATALIPALVVSGLPAHNFSFEGFLPPKKGRQTRLQKLAEENRTIIFYESPHRIIRTLQDLANHFGEDRPATLSREISKKFEETRRGSIAELLHSCENHPPKGELVLCVGAKT